MSNNLTTVQYDVGNLIFAEYNPRELTQDQHQDLKDSITRFGFVDPLIVNTHKERKNILVGGHQRLKIAKELGYKDVPCVEVDLSPDQEKELNVRLNKNTGQWDWDALANHFDVGELLEWGFSEDELQFTEPDVQGLTDDDDIPEVEESITKQGDLWILGEHRLLCGDATKKEDVERLMDGQKADMVFTDPPYNVGKDYLGENLSESEFAEFHQTYLGLIFNHINNNSPTYFCFGVKYLFQFADELRKHIKPRLLIWYKPDSHGVGGGDFFYNYEAIFYGSLSGKMETKSYKSEARDVWIINKAKEKDGGFDHPTVKPVGVPIAAIETSSKQNNKVLDIFLGSGSTLIACEKTNRKCYGMEIDPHYCDVIVKRWEDYTGNKAERFEAASA